MSNLKTGCLTFVEELHSMLINHTERPAYNLTVSLVSRENKDVIESGSFKIYANNPILKIKEKVKELGKSRRLYKLAIEKFEEVESGYILVISI